MTTTNSDIFNLLKEGQTTIREDLRTLQEKVDKGFTRLNGRLDSHDSRLTKLEVKRDASDAWADRTKGALATIICTLALGILGSCIKLPPDWTPEPAPQPTDSPTPTVEVLPDTPVVPEDVTLTPTETPLPTSTPTATEEPTVTPTPPYPDTPTPLPVFTFGILTPSTPLGGGGFCAPGPVHERGILRCMLNLPGYVRGPYQCVRPNHYTGNDVSCPSVLYSGNTVEVTEKWEKCDELDGGVIERWWFIPERGWVAEFINLDRFSCVSAVKVNSCPEG